jgi:hypothetical protein
MKKILASMLLFATLPLHAQGQDKDAGVPGTGDEKPAASATFDADRNHLFYVGAGLQDSTLTVSNPQDFGGVPAGHYRSSFWDLRAGYRLFKAVGVEAHYGFSDQGLDDPSRYKLRNYYALYVVPTARISGLFELAFPMGYTSSGVTALADSTPVDRHLSSFAYGARVELPLRVFWRTLPDLRLTGGGTVLSQRSDAHEYGFDLGLRYDFGLGTSGV